MNLFELYQFGQCQQSNNLPKISIVTPSYNYGCFIEETITSVFKQNYPNLEYFIIDGQSKDNTVDIIRKYEHHLTDWISEPDGGAPDAIEKGFKKCTGELFNWLNADDWLFPGSLWAVGSTAKHFPDYDIYALLGANAGPLGLVLPSKPYLPQQHLYYSLMSNRSLFAQESTFVRRLFLIENHININKSFSNIFDTVMYEEMLLKNARVLFINVLGGAIRHHPQAKTSKGLSHQEYETYQKWEKRNFTTIQRSWRRFSKTRFHIFQQWICNYSPARKFTETVLKQKPKSAAICTLVQWDPRDRDAWRVEHL